MSQWALAPYVVPVLLTGLWGCEGPQVFGDLARELVPRSNEGYEPEGRRLLEGNFHDLWLEAAPPTRDFAMARTADGELVLHSIGTDRSCRIPDVESYQAAVWSSFELEAAAVPFVRVDDGVPTLHFADFECAEADVAVPGGRVVDHLPLPAQRGALVEDDARGVFAVSPWLERSVPLGRRVLGEAHPLRFSILVQDGAIVLYDASVEPILTLGTDVVEVALLPIAEQLVFVDANRDLFVASLGQEGLGVRQIGSDVCGLLDAGPTGAVVAYYSPCDEQRLTLYRPTALGFPRGEFPLSSEAAAPRIVTRSVELETGIEARALSAVFFRDLAADTGSGELWAHTAGHDPIRLAERVRNSWMLAVYDPRHSKVIAFTLSERAEGVDLSAVDGEVSTVVARDVIALYESQGSLLVTAEGSSEQGDLILLESRPFEGLVLREPELLLSNALAGIELTKTVVLEDVIAEGTSRIDVGTDRLGLFRTGRTREHALYLTRQSLLDGSFAEPELVTRDAGPSYLLSQNLPALVLALVRSGEGSYGLRQLSVESSVDVRLAERVTEFHESSIPGREGIVYATSGASAGLWFSSLR